MREFRQSFTQISSAEWLEILILLGVAAILGFFIGWLLRSFSVKKLRRLLGEKAESYDTLNKTHQQKLGFFREMEAENNEMTNRLTVLNDEIKSLKLKLTNNNGSAIVDAETTALEVTEEGELIETDNTSKPGWLNRIRSAFTINNNPTLLENSNEITVEEKLDASNNMIDRLLSSNEKLEDENEKLKQNLLSLEDNMASYKKNTPTVVEPAVVVKKELDVEKVDKYTNSLKDAKTTSKDLLKRIEELEIYNGKIIKQLEAETKEKSSSQKKLLESGDYKSKYLELAPKFETVEIDNNKLKARVSELKSTAKTDILNGELKKKEDALAICNNEKNALTQKLETTSKSLSECNKQQEDLKVKLETANKNKAKQTQPVNITPPAAPAKVVSPPAPSSSPAKITPSPSFVKATPSSSSPPPQGQSTKTKKEGEEDKSVLEASHDIMRRIKNKANSIDFSRIGTADAAAKDDLKKVKGIGEFVEKKLNALGIYNFKQLANLTEDDMDKVNDAIEFFPGRIKRDNWVEQAKNFIKK